MTPKRACVCVCVCECGDGGIYSPTSLKLGTVSEKSHGSSSMRPLRRFQESKIPNPYISVLFYSVQISFMQFFSRDLDCAG